MAKRRVTAIVKIQLPAGKATPAPPVGTALGPHGVQTMEFVKQYNAATEDKPGQVIPVEITICSTLVPIARWVISTPTGDRVDPEVY